MKVYVITSGCYSDYHICSVNLDKNKADELAKKYSTRYDSANIEVFDTEEEEEVLKFENVYVCWYYEKNDEIKVNESEFSYFEYDDLKVSKTGYGLVTYVLANTKDDALKIASDKFAKYRAEKLNL